MIESVIGLIAALCAAVAIVDTSSRRRGMVMVAAVVLAPALIAGDQWNATQVEELRNSPALLIAALAVVGVVVAVLAGIFTRWPMALPVLILVALPFRVPLDVGGEEANLLMPLYLVMAGGVAASAWQQWIRPESGISARPERVAPHGIAAWVKPLLAASVVIFALGLFWSYDRSTGLQNLCFFLIPFAVIFALMVDFEWTPKRLRTTLVVIVGLALICTLIAFAEHQFRFLLWNETVIRTNDFNVYFRVNSLFWDPNVFGRYLALAITLVAATLIWSRNRKETIVLCAVAAILWLGLVITYSQSSFIALLAGLAVLVALRWSLKWVLVGSGVLVVGVILFATVAGGVVKLDLSRLNAQSAGRANLIEGGINLFEARPIQGYGSGAFSKAFRDKETNGNAPVVESHTEPVTVAAEQGLVGLAIYVALIISVIAALTAGMRAVMPGLGAAPGARDKTRGPPASRAAILAAFVAVLVHTITYAGFLDDPITWVLIAIGYSLAFPCRATSAA
ncbi:MAG: O-antigen ligase family protein [Solirubrobacterales bacterium]